MTSTSKEDPVLKKTALNETHQALGATLVDFGGWEMPLWYPTGAVAEHLAVIKGAGLFDTSHMSVITIEGEGIRDFINHAMTKDISSLGLGRAGYGIFLNEKGCAIDDSIVYPIEEDRFAIVVNASMNETVVNHLKTLPGADAFTFTDHTGKIGKIDLQGPAAVRIARKFVRNADELFEKFPYFSFKGDFDFVQSLVLSNEGISMLLSRTGYTGELGFEIFVPVESTVDMWQTILKAGESEGLIPCGLAARDSLRGGAVLALSHQDIGDWPFVNNPWPWALPMDAGGNFTKDFVGRDALDPKTASHTLPFAGFDPRKIDAHGSSVLLDGQPIGEVTTSVADMAIGRVDGKIYSLNSPDKPEGWTPKGLSCGFVKVDRSLPVGTIVELKDARRTLKVEIVNDVRPNRSARWALNK